MTASKEILENREETLHTAAAVPGEAMHSEHEEIHEEDLSGFSKDDLLKYIGKFKNSTNLLQAQHYIKQAKNQFDSILETERNEILQRFIEGGGDEADFHFKKDDTTKEFEKLVASFKEQIHKTIEGNEKSKVQNLVKKEELLSRLRALISEEENTKGIEEFKKIQEEWKKTGQVPAGKSQELWANYNALVDMFYNNRSIYFELMELDRKKNLEAKLEICEKTEALTKVSSINEALKELRNLHDEFKNIGPVPKEEQEKVWEKFKIASDKVYERRNEYADELKKQQENNYAKKLELIKRAQAFSEFNSERIDEWKVKNNELLELQKEWKNAGAVPLIHTKEVSKSFWNACKEYFKVKNNFFGKLEATREENLRRKTALCVEAEALINEQDLARAISQVKNLQEKWKKVGQVPLKVKDSIYERFKAAGDKVFDQRREQEASRLQEYTDNLLKKTALCERIEAETNAGSTELAKVRAFQEEWRTIGHVSREALPAIQERFNKALDTYLEKGGLDANEKQNIKLSMEVATLKAGNDGDKTLKKKEGDLSRKISALKGEIDRYQTNMDFLANSRNADALKQSVLNNIAELQKELKVLEQQLKIIKSA